jgi:hypothetical protein
VCGDARRRVVRADAGLEDAGERELAPNGCRGGGVMSADIFHVDEKTNIHVEPHPDQKHIALTTVVDGKPTVTITYAIDELLTFVQILLHNLDKIR